MIEMTVKMGGGGGGGCYTSAHYDIILLKNKNIKKGVDKPFIVLKMCGFIYYDPYKISSFYF